jgi:hypothetical protein
VRCCNQLPQEVVPSPRIVKRPSPVIAQQSPPKSSASSF